MYKLCILLFLVHCIIGAGPAWIGTYQVNSAPCEQYSICCCIVGPLIVTAGPGTLAFKFSSKGNKCVASGGTNVPTPSTYVINNIPLLFSSDHYTFTLSQDSSWISLADTTNSQCSVNATKISATTTTVGGATQTTGTTSTSTTSTSTPSTSTTSTSTTSISTQNSISTTMTQMNTNNPVVTTNQNTAAAQTTTSNQNTAAAQTTATLAGGSRYSSLYSIYLIVALLISTILLASV